MRDLNTEELGSVYGAGGSSKKGKCGSSGGSKSKKSKKSKSKISKSKKSMSKKSRGRCWYALTRPWWEAERLPPALFSTFPKALSAISARCMDGRT